jgi:hypothetical protein
MIVTFSRNRQVPQSARSAPIDSEARELPRMFNDDFCRIRNVLQIMQLQRHGNLGLMHLAEVHSVDLLSADQDLETQPRHHLMDLLLVAQPLALASSN